MPLSTQILRASLATTAAVARTWFEERASIITRQQFETRGGLADKGAGSVYAYFTAAGRAVYIGETGRAVKARLHDVTSPHKSKPWWKKWAYMRFLPLPEAVDRLILESLLVAGYEPSENEKPSAKSISELFPI